MIFLIDYDRRKGEIIEMIVFDDSQRHQAEDARLELELRHHRSSVNREVVHFEAGTEKALRRTHDRYFCDLQQLAERLRDAITR